MSGESKSGQLKTLNDGAARAQDAQTLLMHEVYASIQGESSFAGLPCTFVRTSRCNLRCRWCDTPQAFKGGVKRKVSEVLEEALATKTPLVEITGGEPLLQKAVLPLMSQLCDAGRTVLIETSGERDISQVDPRVHRIMDIKCPGSGESEKNRWSNIDLLSSRDEVKFVLSHREDYEWARAIIAKYDLATRVNEVLMSAVFGELPTKEIVDWSLSDGLPVRVQVQMHKYIWEPDQVGV